MDGVGNGCCIVKAWQLLDLIGEGSYASVYRARHCNSGKCAAVKVLNLQAMARNSPRLGTVDRAEKRVLKEVQILRRMNHKNIIKLLDQCRQEDTFYIIMELAEGGELYDYILKKVRLGENQARQFFRQLISAIEYCHGNFVIHRDLKPENILLDRRRGNIKIIDFGMSNIVRPGKLLYSSCGSFSYIAPEVVSNEGYVGPAADLWSMGVILFVMVHGYHPFTASDCSAYGYIRAATSCDYTVNTCLVSSYCADVIERLLEPNVDNRLSMSQLRQHPWVISSYDGPPACCLPVAYPTDDIDPDCIVKLAYFGFKPVDTVLKVKAGVHCQEVAMYHSLLHQKRQEEQVHHFTGCIKTRSNEAEQPLTTSIRKQKRPASYSGGCSHSSKNVVQKVKNRTLLPFQVSRALSRLSHIKLKG